MTAQEYAATFLVVFAVSCAVSFIWHRLDRWRTARAALLDAQLAGHARTSRLLDENLLEFHLNKKQMCPDCDSELFLRGPTGGMATNIKCAECGSTFRYAPPFTPERIPDTDLYTRTSCKLEDL